MLIVSNIDILVTKPFSLRIKDCEVQLLEIIICRTCEGLVFMVCDRFYLHF